MSCRQFSAARSRTASRGSALEPRTVGRRGGKSRRDAARLVAERLEQRLALAALFPYSQTFVLDSLPGATKTIFLDFTGHRTQGTSWNVLASDVEIVCGPFSVDGDAAFSTAEQDVIQAVWAHVAEDFRPFNVNVTTREPAVASLVFSGSGDSRWGIRCVISDASKDENPSSPFQGVALLNSFKSSVDTPCFVDTDGLVSAVDIALVASHEIGHSLGAEHHGSASNSGLPNPIDGKFDYYTGHGDGPVSWGPIMGAPYGRRMTQWSRGEYASASRPFQDDLAILANLNGVGGFTYRADDRGSTFGAAGGLAILPGNRTQQASGIIERNTDSDMFRFTVKSGVVGVAVRPFDLIDSLAFTGANLDVGMTIYSSDGRVVFDSQPADRLDARFNGPLVGGTYYVKVFGTGNADPLSSGYSNYGSLGQYTVEVTEQTSTQPIVSVTGPASVVEGTGRTTAVPFTVQLSSASATPVTVTYATRDGTAKLADGDYTAASGTLTFAPGETKKVVSVSVAGDSRFESNESLAFEVSSPVNALLGRGEAVVTVVNDDKQLPQLALVSVFGPSGAVPEGSAAVFTIALASPATRATTVNYRTVSGAATAGRDFRSKVGTVTFAAGESAKTVSIDTLDDTLGENAEVFYVDISVAASVGKVVTRRAEATIALSDGGKVSSFVMRAAFAAAAGPATSSKPLRLRAS